MLFKIADAESAIICNKHGSVDLYYDNTKMAYTSASGFDVTNGDLRAHLDLKILNDDRKLFMGAGADFRLYHNGSHSFIDNNTGDLNIESSNVYIKTNNTENSVSCINNSGVTLYYDNTSRFQTTDYGALLTGPGNYTTLLLERSGGTDSGKVQGWSNGDTREIGFAHPDSANWFLRCDKNTNNGGTAAIFFTTVYPSANNNYDLGTSSNRWRNVYVNDFHLSNEGHSNDVDGTWGDWTIQEGESDLFLKNNRSGKKYKFNLTEVS